MIVIMIIWEFDLQLPMQSVPITTNVSLNPAHCEVYSIQHYVIKIKLKVVLNTITLNPSVSKLQCTDTTLFKVV